MYTESLPKNMIAESTTSASSLSPISRHVCGTSNEFHIENFIIFFCGKADFFTHCAHMLIAQIVVLQCLFLK